MAAETEAHTASKRTVSILLESFLVHDIFFVSVPGDEIQPGSEIVRKYRLHHTNGKILFLSFNLITYIQYHFLHLL